MYSSPCGSPGESFVNHTVLRAPRSALFTDIAGSTARWERQPQAMERALARHDDLLRQAIDAYGGHVVKTVGDAFQAVFTTVTAGLRRRWRPSARSRPNHGGR